MEAVQIRAEVPWNAADEGRRAVPRAARRAGRLTLSCPEPVLDCVNGTARTGLSIGRKINEHTPRPDKLCSCHGRPASAHGDPEYRRLAIFTGGERPQHQRRGREQVRGLSVPASSHAQRKVIDARVSVTPSRAAHRRRDAPGSTVRPPRAPPSFLTKTSATRR